METPPQVQPPQVRSPLKVQTPKQTPTEMRSPKQKCTPSRLLAAQVLAFDLPAANVPIREPVREVEVNVMSNSPFKSNPLLNSPSTNVSSWLLYEFPELSFTVIMFNFIFTGVS